MKKQPLPRRKFLRDVAATSAGLFTLSSFANPVQSAGLNISSNINEPYLTVPAETRIRFSVIGINHGHIYSMIEAVIRGGGEMVGFYANAAARSASFA